MAEETREWGITIHLMSRMSNKLKDKGWKRYTIPPHLRDSHLDEQQIFKKIFTYNTYKPGGAISLALKDLHDTLDCEVEVEESIIGKKCIGAISLDGNHDTYFEYIFKN